jgi:type VI secretion system protein ImpA
MSIEDLLQPISAAQPCGNNLEYDADFQALEQTAVVKREQQYGSVIIAAEAPDWLLVERLASGLLKRTKDLLVMVHLCHAWTRLKGLNGYTDGLHLLRHTLAHYGHQVFPQLDFEGEFDPYLRTNALAALGDQSALGQAVQAAMLLKTASGEISLRDACSLLDRSQAECPGFPGGRAHLLDELSKADRPAYQTVRMMARGIADLRDSIEHQLGEESLPAMDRLLKCVAALTRVGNDFNADFNAALNAPAEVSTAGTGTTPSVFMQPSGEAGPSGQRRQEQNGRIGSREEALQALKRVQEYFRNHEPSHPAPLMLERVQRMISMDFLQILQDMAPDCLGPVKTILGTSGNPEQHGKTNG